MELMPSNSVDFKYMASVVVDEYARSGKSLTDCVAEAAIKHDFTPEEIKRLVEKTNTELALRHLRGEGKKDNFELASYATVLKRTHGDSESDEGESTEQDKEATLPMQLGSSALPFTRRVKSAGDPFACGTVKTASVRKLGGSEYYALRKQYDKACSLKVATEMRLQSDIDWLASEFNKKTPDDIAKVAHTVEALYGDDARRVVDILTGRTGKTASASANINWIVESGDATVFDDTAPIMRKVASVCSDLRLLEKQARRVSQFERVVRAGENAIRALTEKTWR